MIRILLADDQPLVRTGFRMILDAEPDMEVIAEAGDGADAVRQARRLRPDVVVMDIRMPVQDGITATAEITAAGHARVLVLTTFHVDEHVVGDNLTSLVGAYVGAGDAAGRGFPLCLGAIGPALKGCHGDILVPQRVRRPR